MGHLCSSNYSFFHTCFKSVPSFCRMCSMRNKMEDFVLDLQSKICSAISEIDGTEFKVDEWQREQGGFGRTMVIQKGNVFEKAGCGVSVVQGTLTKEAIMQMKSRGKDIKADKVKFFAAGISLVFHPWNPHCPTVHLNYRYFEIVDEESNASDYWFGGGSDLTPSILYEEDAIHFHKELKEACDKYDPLYYSAFKNWCDKYFYIPHRNECRGVGGIFLDDLAPLADLQTVPQVKGLPKDQIFEFIKACGYAFLPSYIPIVLKRKDMDFSQPQKDWQQIRRGRYVEFNLVYDRGTKFGLYTPGARIESILMSLPLTSSWEYMHEPPHFAEDLILVLKEPKQWVS
eukprot:NODE_234_length_13549_cov_0.394349.p3 type:complete len:343 gc:universal NODE_234_length_13549_cov_0.394349:10721-9693(-)